MTFGISDIFFMRHFAIFHTDLIGVLSAAFQGSSNQHTYMSVHVMFSTVLLRTDKRLLLCLDILTLKQNNLLAFVHRLPFVMDKVAQTQWAILLLLAATLFFGGQQ